MKKEFQEVTQKAFLAAVEAQEKPDIGYEYLGRFTLKEGSGGGLTATTRQTGVFLGRIGEKLDYETYYQLTRQVWLAALHNS